MGMADNAFVAVNSGAVAVLLQAGLYKFAVPAPLGRALIELAPRMSNVNVNGLARGVAAVEVLTGLALLAPATHVSGASATVVLGVLFAVLGVVGRLRRSAAPCGCLGGAGSRALGLVNVAVGLVLALFGVFAATVPYADTPYRLGPVLAALFLLLLCVWMSRGLALQLLRRKASTAQVGSG